MVLPPHEALELIRVRTCTHTTSRVSVSPPVSHGSAQHASCKHHHHHIYHNHHQRLMLFSRSRRWGRRRSAFVAGAGRGIVVFAPKLHGAHSRAAARVCSPLATSTSHIQALRSSSLSASIGIGIASPPSRGSVSTRSTAAIVGSGGRGRRPQASRCVPARRSARLHALLPSSTLQGEEPRSSTISSIRPSNSAASSSASSSTSSAAQQVRRSHCCRHCRAIAAAAASIIIL